MRAIRSYLEKAGQSARFSSVCDMRTWRRSEADGAMCSKPRKRSNSPPLNFPVSSIFLVESRNEQKRGDHPNPTRGGRSKRSRQSTPSDGGGVGHRFVRAFGYARRRCNVGQLRWTKNQSRGDETVPSGRIWTTQDANRIALVSRSDGGLFVRSFAIRLERRPIPPTRREQSRKLGWMAPRYHPNRRMRGE